MLQSKELGREPLVLEKSAFSYRTSRAKMLTDERKDLLALLRAMRRGRIFANGEIPICQLRTLEKYIFLLKR